MTLNNSKFGNEDKVPGIVLYLFEIWQYKTHIDMENLKKEFQSRLLETKREGMENVIKHLERLGFFTAPASTKFHLNVKGGLMQHSWNVCNTALMLRNQMILMKPELEAKLPVESVIIASLLHDVCKSNIYKDAILNRKNDQGYWEKVPGYEVDYSSLPLGHGEKSVIMLLTLGLRLTRDEMLAIRWHMTAWELPFHSSEAKANLNAARETAPLCTIIQTADGLSSALLED